MIDRQVEEEMAGKIKKVDYGKLADITTELGGALFLDSREVVTWQCRELQHFVMYLFRLVPVALIEQPLKIQSGQYEETYRLERTQADLINETAQELMALPRFTAYAKLLHHADDGDRPEVKKCEIETLPMQTQSARGYHTALMETAIENAHTYGMRRDNIEQEIRKRQDRWKGRPPPTQHPKAEPEPPPTFTLWDELRD